MFFIKQSYHNSLIRDQEDLIKKGYVIVDIIVTNNGYMGGYGYFIKYKKG